MTIDIRPPHAGDHDAWLPLWRGYLDFYEAEIGDGVTAETWRRLLDPAHAIRGFVAADDGGQLVGLVHYLFHPVTWSLAERCYLEDLFVRPEARGLGAGRALIEAVYRVAEEAGADQVYWLTAHDNATARRLYDRVGRLTPFVKYRR
jgi:ribosomal protein S18 acetylase RimI-like enzyme